MSATEITALDAPRKGILTGPKNLIVGTLLAMTPVTALLVLGWFMRDMRRVAQAASGGGQTAVPGWVLNRDGEGVAARWLGGFAANIREGLMAGLALALGTLPFAGFWITSWWAGWDNSFNKGYEQAFIGPATGLLGLGIFMVMMVYLPMAQAHMAVENRLSAFFEFARIRSAARHAGLSQLFWAFGLAFFSLPIFAARGLPTFVEGIIPGFADFTATEVQDLQTLIALVMSAYIFATLLIFRRRQARIYATAVGRARLTGEHDLWAGTRLSAFANPQRAYRPNPLLRMVYFVVLMGIWWCVAAMIYVGQFLNHDWHVWLTHPLIFLPWMP